MPQQPAARPSIPVIDVFAGPGGLNEGFASFQGGAAFDVVGSFEMDDASIATLTTRATQRLLRRPDGTNHPVHEGLLRGQLSLETFTSHHAVRDRWDQAARHVHKVELGPDTRDESDALISAALEGLGANGRWVLIGGPPCQAYSMAGRSRRKHDVTFESDKKHFLYREYLHIIEKFKPAVFVMENVKGMLSTTHGGSGLFDRIQHDLKFPGGVLAGQRYRLRSLTVHSKSVQNPRDFVVRSEHHGVPQARHRVIMIGIREDVHIAAPDGWAPLAPSPKVTLRDVLQELPAVRSRVSPRSADSPARWEEIRAEALGDVRGETTPSEGGHWVSGRRQVEDRPEARRLLSWLRPQAPDAEVGFAQHEARAHMQSDLLRYAYLADKALRGERLKVQDLPESLRPAHKNLDADVVPFADRFRVQRWDHPSSTVVAHLSKDGHYFIHPDPVQMRSITVREAARLQTFPDDYFFAGNRTKQFQQVGNAVPPFLAHQIAQRVHGLLTHGDSSDA